LPDLRTIDYWLGPAKDDTEERRPQGAVMGQHCRAGGAQRRFGVLLGEDFRHTEDLETYVLAVSTGHERSLRSRRYAFNTQVLQSEAMAFAYRSWRREWRGPGKQFVRGVRPTLHRR
jgi:beta-mannosidase